MGKRILCCSVRLQSLVAISDKAYRATAFDGSSDIIPASQVFGRDWDVMKSDAWWISGWILEKKNLQYSNKKTCWFDTETRDQLPTFTIKKHKPLKITPVKDNEISELER